jgi:hypothetical protein
MTVKKLYDFLKFMALVVFPSVGALYWALAEIWHFPLATQVMGSFAALDAFLGLFISKISRDYEINRPKPLMMGDLLIQQYPNGEVSGMRLITDKLNPIFLEDSIVGYKVRRETVEEPPLDD